MRKLNSNGSIVVTQLGEQGPSGYSGTSGFSGKSGYSGQIGPSGYTGFSGTSGKSGFSGQDGLSGTSGYSGLSGTSGESGISGFSGQQGTNAGQIYWFNNAASDISTPSIIGNATIAFVNSNPDTITRADAGSFVTDGFVAFQKITVSGSSVPANNATWTVSTVTATTITLITANSLTASGAGSAITILTQNEQMTRLPPTGIEIDESVVTSSSDVSGATLDCYMTPSNVPGVLDIPVGTISFHGFAYVSGGSVNLKYILAKKDSITGVTTTLFTTGLSDPITSTSAVIPDHTIVTYTVSSPISLLATDRIVTRVIFVNPAGARTCHFLYQGANHSSYVQTTLSVTAPSGASGFSGWTGYSGENGTSGYSGYSGSDGLPGTSGTSGFSGTAGSPGTPGTSGTSGQAGTSGYSGIGTSGYSGTSGQAGTSGYSGISGTNGGAGTSGYSGISGTSGEAGTSGTSGTSGYSGLGSATSTNLLYNGDFNIWQRGTTAFNSAAHTSLTADCWQVRRVVGDGDANVLLSTDVPTVAESNHKSANSLRVDCSHVETAVAATEFWLIQTALEGYDYAQIAGQAHTVSFWVKATKTGTYSFVEHSSNWDYSAVYEYVVNSSDTWEKKVINCVASTASGTWSYVNSLGIGFSWALMCGSTYTTSTLGSWQSGTKIAGSNQVNGFDSVANDFRLSQVQVQPGTLAATQYMDVQIADELARCQRYYLKYETTSGKVPYTPGGIARSATTVSVPYQFATPMLAVPTIGGTAANQWASAIVVKACSAYSVTADPSNTKTVWVNFTVATGLTAGHAEFMYGAADATLNFTSEILT